MKKVSKAGRLFQLFLFLSSAALAISAQPDWSVLGSILTACLSYGIFWKGAALCQTRKETFFAAVLWFAVVSGCHLSWFFADRYVGNYIFVFLAFIFLALGAQFGLITLMVRQAKRLTITQMLGISGAWALCEWLRLYFLAGYTLDPVGMALTGTLTGLQMASVVGIYGLSFWIIFTNLCALKFFSSGGYRNVVVWGTVACFPYVFGWFNLSLHGSRMQQGSASIKALVVQTALTPEDKYPIAGSVPIPVAEQWKRILAFLAPYKDQPIQLIVMPEGTVNFGTHVPIYNPEFVKQVFQEFYGHDVTLPETSHAKVGNHYWAECLAHVTKSHVIIGLEDGKDKRAFNCAFLLSPTTQESLVYQKRVLVPMGEYIPFQWCKKILSQYGISDSYTPGREVTLFPLHHSILAGTSICYEETYAHLTRETRQKGANLLINLTNDIWFPRTRLPTFHFSHGRVRAVETGAPLIRACNTGVTCGIDSLGRLQGFLPFEDAHSLAVAGVLPLELPLYEYSTLYTRFGNGLVIGFSFIYFTLFCLLHLFKIKRFALIRSLFYRLRKN